MPAFGYLSTSLIVLSDDKTTLSAAYLELTLKLKCPRRDLNPEPTDYESAALTVELQGHKK
jgi:hypothetical protein